MPPSPTRRLAGRKLVSIPMHIIGIFHRTLQCRWAAGSGKGRMGSDHSLFIWEAKFVNSKLVCFSASGPWWICLTCLQVTGPKAPPLFPSRLPPSGAGNPISTQIDTFPGLPAGRTPGGCCKALICTLAVASSISQARMKTALYLPGWSIPPLPTREKINHTHAPSRNSSSNFSACHLWERYSCCCHHRQKRNTHTHRRAKHNNPPISLHIKSQEIFLECVFLPLTLKRLHFWNLQPEQTACLLPRGRVLADSPPAQGTLFPPSQPALFLRCSYSGGF